MTELFTTILMRMTVAGIAAAVAMHVTQEGAMREIIKVACGLLLVLALLQPLQQLRLPAPHTWFGGREQISVAELEKQNAIAAMNAVGNAIGTVIQRRAEEMGMACRAAVEMEVGEDGTLQTKRVTIYYTRASEQQLAALSEMIERECGVGAERQEMIRE